MDQIADRPGARGCSRPGATTVPDEELGSVEERGMALTSRAAVARVSLVRKSVQGMCRCCQTIACSFEKNQRIDFQVAPDEMSLAQEAAGLEKHLMLLGSFVGRHELFAAKVKFNGEYACTGVYSSGETSYTPAFIGQNSCGDRQGDAPVSSNPRPGRL